MSFTQPHTEEELVSIICNNMEYVSLWNTSCLVLVVTDSPRHSYSLAEAVVKQKEGVVYNKLTRALEHGKNQYRFVTKDVNIKCLLGLQPISWIAATDNIPAALVNLLNVRTKMGMTRHTEKMKGSNND